jgi:hypothetical protein
MKWLAAACLALAALTGCAGSDGDAEDSELKAWQDADLEAAGGSVSEADFEHYRETILELCEQSTADIRLLLTAASMQSEENGDDAVLSRMVAGLVHACPERIDDVQREIDNLLAD